MHGIFIKHKKTKLGKMSKKKPKHEGLLKLR